MIPERDGFLVADALNARNAAGGLPVPVPPREFPPLPMGHGMTEHSSSMNGHGDAAAIENLDDLLAADDRPITPVYIKALKRNVYLRAMSGIARDALEQANFGEDDKGDPKLKTEGRLARTAAMHLVTKAGERYVVGPEAIARLNERLGAPALTEIVIAAGTLSQTDDASVEKAAGNSDGDRSADS